MDKLLNYLNFNHEVDVHQLWEEILQYTYDNKNSAFNLVVGLPQNGDTVLWQEVINKEGKTWGWAEHTICYPPENNQNMPKAVITVIAVIDIKNDEKGGCAVIESGGVGAKSVKIKLEANFWRRMSFQVIIIGKLM